VYYIINFSVTTNLGDNQNPLQSYKLYFKSSAIIKKARHVLSNSFVLEHDSLTLSIFYMFL